MSPPDLDAFTLLQLNNSSVINYFKVYHHCVRNLNQLRTPTMPSSLCDHHSQSLIVHLCSSNKPRRSAHVSTLRPLGTFLQVSHDLLTQLTVSFVPVRSSSIDTKRFGTCLLWRLCAQTCTVGHLLLLLPPTHYVRLS